LFSLSTIHLISEKTIADQYSGRAADVWAAGASLFMMLFGHPPYVADNVPDLYIAIQTEPCVPFYF
jgi:[calcium/calmodulin-dependent protein kinase] kinase